MKNNNYKSGDIIKVKVTAIKHYGAFIETKDGVQGLIHISEIDNSFIVDINYYLKIGEIIEIKILSIIDNKINGTLNFNNKSLIKKSSDIYFSDLKNTNLKYGFSTLKENLDVWRKTALSEIKNSSK